MLLSIIDSAQESSKEVSVELIYYEDHDKRYAHIPKHLRPLYPDEIRRGWMSPVIKRTKPSKEVTSEDVCFYNAPASLIANDCPYTDGCYDGGGYG